MKLHALKLGLFIILGLINVEAKALTLTPADCGTTFICATTSFDPAQPTASDIQSLMGTSAAINDIFKADVDTGITTGAYFDIYEALFDGDIDGSYHADIYYLGNGFDDFIDCVECYLTVKDGAHDPSLYVFNISGWDGQEDILLRNFWSNSPGSISNVAIWGLDGNSTTTVPEPGTLALLGLGLIGMAFGRKKIS